MRYLLDALAVVAGARARVAPQCRFIDEVGRSQGGQLSYRQHEAFSIALRRRRRRDGMPDALRWSRGAWPAPTRTSSPCFAGRSQTCPAVPTRAPLARPARLLGRIGRRGLRANPLHAAPSPRPVPELIFVTFL